MKAKVELNAADIKQVFADYYGLDGEEITVSPRAKVTIPADAAPRAAAVQNEPKEPDEDEARQCVPCQPTQPECGPCEYAEEPKPAESGRGMSRAERLFGKREDWRTAEPQAVRGFVVLKCQQCGRVKSMFFREPQTVFKCFSCGTDNPLTYANMKRLHTNCPKCGNVLNYRTNLTAQFVEVPCKQCGATIDCELNPKGTEYDTVR